MQVGADPRRRLRRDRSFAEQVDRHAARRARIGIDAARGAVGTGLGIEHLDQMRAPYLVAPPLVLLVLPVVDARLPVPAIGEFAAQAQPASSDRNSVV